MLYSYFAKLQALSQVVTPFELLQLFLNRLIKDQAAHQLQSFSASVVVNG
jgi:hypothetical protein